MKNYKNLHITTIEKSMKMIIELSNKESPDYNQIVRWVINKEDHANKIQKIVSQYFLHQRIKPVEPKNEELYKKYIERLTLLHDLSIYAMKAKQTTDLSYIKKLSRAIHDFEHAYFHTHDHDHGHDNGHSHAHDHGHSHDHGNGHDHGHSHDHAHHPYPHADHPHGPRTLKKEIA